MGSPPQWPDPPQQEPTPQNPNPNPPRPALLQRLMQNLRGGWYMLFPPRVCAMCNGSRKFMLRGEHVPCRFCESNG